MRRKEMPQRNWRPAYEKTMALCRHIGAGDCSPGSVERMWRDAFANVLMYLGFPRKLRSLMWEELVLGNWKRLHLTEEELAKGAGEWLEDLRGDAFYCSDRWSLDRLARVHWTYRAYMEAARREEARDEQLR